MTNSPPLPHHATKTWVVVADGHQARIFARKPGSRIDPSAPRTDEIETWTLEPIPGLGAMAEPITTGRHHPPGLVFESVGALRHAPEVQPDPRSRSKMELAKRVADQLNTAFAARRFDRLAVVAPPHFLGMLRSHYGQGVRDSLFLEIDKDFTALNATDLADRLSHHWPAREGPQD